jgi:ribosomal protein S18 acetylase RimI-like enzyme
MEGVLLVTFPGRLRFSLWSVPALAQSLLLPFQLARHVSLGDLMRRARLLSGPTSEMRRRVKAQGKHIHVDMIAVGERYRGQRFMSRMMRAVLAEAEKRGERCVLETETETNVQIYRHFGFRQEWKMEAVPGRLTYYVMVYDPENVPRAGDL